MSIESVKSIILVLLIGFSLLLTAALWNYQPRYDLVKEEGVIEKTKIGGQELELSSLITPEQYVFHEGDDHYSYMDVKNVQTMYKAMSEWPLLNINMRPNSDPDLSNHREMVEIIFSTKLPVQVITHIFNVENHTQFATLGEFDRIYFVYNNRNQSGPSVEVWIMNSDEGAKLQASVPESNGRMLTQELVQKEHLVEQVRFSEVASVGESNDVDHDIYLPKDPMVYPLDVLTSNSISVKPLKNILFPNPAIVSSYSTSSVDQRLQDSSRRLDVFENQTRMKYVHMIPNQTISNSQSRYDLITQSLDFINLHRGWTDSYRLANVQNQPSQVKYQMYYNHLPILSSPANMATMSVTYEQDKVQEYIRPLTDFTPYIFGENNSNDLDDQTQELISGEIIARYLRDSDNYEVDQIENVKVGYSLIQQTGGSLAFHLVPDWFVLRNGKWEKINIEDHDLNRGGG